MRKYEDYAFEVRADVNVTSLVDVAFVLLIIFIITAPILQGGIDVSVPEGDVDPLRADEATVTVSVSAAGSIFIGESPVTREDFAEAFGQFVTSTQPDRILVKSDSTASWGATFDVISTVKESGVSFALVGEDRRR